MALTFLVGRGFKHFGGVALAFSGGSLVEEEGLESSPPLGPVLSSWRDRAEVLPPLMDVNDTVELEVNDELLEALVLGRINDVHLGG